MTPGVLVALVAAIIIFAVVYGVVFLLRRKKASLPFVAKKPDMVRVDAILTRSPKALSLNALGWKQNILKKVMTIALVTVAVSLRSAVKNSDATSWLLFLGINAIVMGIFAYVFIVVEVKELSLSLRGFTVKTILKTTFVPWVDVERFEIGFGASKQGKKRPCVQYRLRNKYDDVQLAADFEDPTRPGMVLPIEDLSEILIKWSDRANRRLQPKVTSSSGRTAVPASAHPKTGAS